MQLLGLFIRGKSRGRPIGFVEKLDSVLCTKRSGFYLFLETVLSSILGLLVPAPLCQRQVSQLLRNSLAFCVEANPDPGTGFEFQPWRLQCTAQVS